MILMSIMSYAELPLCYLNNAQQLHAMILLKCMTLNTAREQLTHIRVHSLVLVNKFGVTFSNVVSV